MIFCALSHIYGQATKIKGFVIDKDTEAAVDGVIIQVKDKAGKNFAYTFSDDNGSFSIDFDASCSASVIVFHLMGYAEKRIRISDIKSPVRVYLESQHTQLDDVIVTAPDIEQRSDTLVYYLSHYAKESDRNIADVLKRLPGIKVEESGEIKYNGEPINKFYIDGADFADGRYGLATENILPSDVASVEVMENHQPIQALQGLEFSQQAGINIKLREQARHRWIAILDGGIGLSPVLYNASAFAMRISGKWQNMETVRINNTGWNPQSQSHKHTVSNLFSSDYIDYLWPDYINLGTSSAPLAENRTRDNFSVLANSSNSWHLDKGKDVRFNLNYESDRLDNLSGYETNYLDEYIPRFIETNSLKSYSHWLNGQGTVAINTPAMYLTDNLYIDAHWQDFSSAVGGTLSLSQKAYIPEFNFTNDLQMVKRVSGNLLSVSSRNRYYYHPHRLDVVYDASVEQELTTQDFRSVTELKYGWLKAKWNIYVRGGLDINYHHLKSNLDGTASPLVTECDFQSLLMRVYAAPEASYSSYRWLVTLSLPIGLKTNHIYGGQTGSNMTKCYLSVAPFVYVRYKLNARMDAIAQLKYSLEPPEATCHIPAAIMQNFRNLYLAVPTTDFYHYRSAAVNLRYRNPIKSLFFNIIGKYDWNSYPLINDQIFLNNYILNTFTLNSNDTRCFNVNGNISKGLMSGKIHISLDASYADVISSAMRDGQKLSYRQSAIVLQPGLKGYFTNWFSTDYKIGYTINKLRIKNGDTSNYQTIKQFLSLVLIPLKGWQFSVGGEHYYTRFSSSRSSNLILVDASATWEPTKKLEFSIKATNILNKKEYRYASYGLLSETDYMYRIRGRNIMLSMQIRI